SRRRSRHPLPRAAAGLALRLFDLSRELTVEPRRLIRFYLNDDLIELDAIAPDRTILDFLRLDRTLRGTKEGCAEGDCGACTVLIGELAGDSLSYHAANACIGFVAMLDGKHVVTIEHLKGSDGALHPV